MEFTIISLGNVEFLSRILNGIAMICGTGDWSRLIAAGFVIGLLFIGFQSILEGGQRINLHQTFMCFLFYLCMFGPSCTVVVEDGYSGETRVVDNLPLGVGVSGAAISGIGHGVTKLMEQGYSEADRTSEHQFAEQLRIINNMRNAGMADEVYAAIDNTLGSRANGQPSDSKQALINYLSECTMAKIQLGSTTPTKLAQSSWASGEYRLSSSAHTVLLPIAGMGANEVVTCNEGYEKLSLIFDKIGTPAFSTALNRYLRISSTAPNGGTPDNLNQIDDAINSMGISMNGSHDMIRMMLIEGVYGRAAQKFYQTQQDEAAALAVNQAIAQRITEWSAESTMFLSIARGLMAFFEGFIYAITPIVGFLIAIGSFGAKLAGKYFLTVAWIQLWLPILSILNLYTNVGARAAFAKTTVGEASFFTLNAIWTDAQNWVATGGMLTAATPMLALFLITGSTYAFTALAGRMNGRDHFNEKIQTPDAVQPSAVMNHLPHYASDRLSGNYVSGALQATPQISVGQTLASNLAHKTAAHSTEAANLTATISQAMASGNSSTATSQLTESVGRSVAQTVMSNGQTVGSYIRQQTGQTADLTSSQYQQLGSTALQLSAGVSGSSSDTVIGSMLKNVAGASLNASATANGMSQSTESLTSSKNASNHFSRSISAQDSQMLAAALQKGTNAGLMEMNSQQWSALSKAEKNDNVSQAFSNMAQATRAVEQATTTSQNLSTTSSMSLLTLANNLRSTDAWHKLANFGRNLSISERSHFSALSTKYQSLLGGDAAQGQVVAALDYMSKRATTNAGFAESLSGYLAQSNVPIGSDMPHQTVTGDIQKPTEGFTQDLVNSGSSLFEHQQGVLRNQQDQISRSISEKYAGADANIQNKHEIGLNDVAKKAEIDASAATKEARNNALHAINQPTENGVGVMLANNVLKDGAIDSAIKWLKDNPPTKPTVLNKETFGDYLSRNAHLQSIGGLTEAQQRYMEAYHNFRYVAPEDQKPVREAIQGLRNEIQQTLFGKRKELTTEQQTRVEQTTRSVMNRLEEAHAVDNQANLQSIMQFNHAFELRTSPRVK